MAKNKTPGKREDKFSPQRFTVRFDVYPRVAMIRESALELAQHLSAHHELTDIHMADESWEFTRPQPRQGQPGGAITVRVKEEEIEIEHLYPNAGLERFEILVDQVIVAIEEVAEPKILLGTSASLEYVVDIGGDARQAILGALQHKDEDESDKLAVFNRPCQFVGLRLGFPAYRTTEDEGAKEERPEDEPPDEPDVGSKPPPLGAADEEHEGADWSATLTLQSAPDEPSKLSVEVGCRWMQPIEWKDVPNVIRERLTIVDDFLKTKISEFLKH